MNLTIVGAGNMGLALTAYLSLKGGNSIRLFTKKDILKSGPVLMRDVEGGIERYISDFHVTSSPEEAFEDADIIFCTYPAFLRKEFLEMNGKYMKAGAKLGFVPGYGGAEYACKELIGRGIIIFGLQRVPYVARAQYTERGIVAGILSRKRQLYAAAIPYKESDSISSVLTRLLDIPCTTLKEYLAITLAPSNPLLHITGLYNVFRSCKADTIYERPLRFYEEWDDEASEILFAYDMELQSICKALSPLDLREVVPLPVYYESPTPGQLTKKLKSIESFKTVMVPLKENKNGYIPDLESRMFTEDFPFGICVIKEFALITGIETPNIDLLLNFYCNLSGHKYFNNDGSCTEEIHNTGVPSNYGLLTKEEIIAFYHKQ
jgi:opine dehydrogenase